MKASMTQEGRDVCPRGSSYFTQRVWLATAIGFVTAGLLVLFVGQAQTATEAELTELIRCSNSCRSTEGTCQAGCCGRIFCRKSCLSDCSNTRAICEEGCYDKLGGSPSGAFFDTATLGPKTRNIHISGPLQCPEGAKADISVTITELSGAIAQGETQVVCPAGETTFTVRAAVDGKPRFQAPSTATACAVAQIHFGARDLRALQWCRDITLLPDGVEIEE